MIEFTAVEAKRLGVPRRAPLFVAGVVPPKPRLAIVGSRAAHRRYLACMPELVSRCGRAGWAVLSGGARGVDVAAHREALEQRVPQLVVLPTSPDNLYPPEHVPLFARIIAAGGGVLCPHPPGTRACRGMFASRNSLIVQLSSRVVALEAGLRSGTRGTLARALAANTPVAGVIGTPGVAWALARGAESLGPPEPAGVGERVQSWLGGAELQQRWPAGFELLAKAFAHQSEVTVNMFHDPIEATVLLVEAESLGLVTELAAGRYTRG